MIDRYTSVAVKSRPTPNECLELYIDFFRRRFIRRTFGVAPLA